MMTLFVWYWHMYRVLNEIQLFQKLKHWNKSKWLFEPITEKSRSEGKRAKFKSIKSTEGDQVKVLKRVN